ncbi:MAG: hypothetical protein ABSH16_02015 [Sedimentisphaerales bacterium]
MKTRIAAIIIFLTVCFCFVGTDAAFAKHKHHHKGVVSSQKIGHKALTHSKKLTKHSSHSHTTSSVHSHAV